MVYLRRIKTHESRNGTLSATMIYHLKIPSDRTISIIVEDRYTTTLAENHRYVFAVIASKLSGEGTVGGQRLSNAMSLDAHLAGGCVFTLWPQEDRGYEWVRKHKKAALDEDVSMVALRFLHSDPSDFMRGLGLGVLLFSSLTSLTVKNGETFDEVAWEALRRCMNLANLSVFQGKHRILLRALSSEAPFANPSTTVLFPRLRFLYLNWIDWHHHHRSCSPPYADEPLSVTLSLLLAARQQTEQPLEELVLNNVMHVDYSTDLAWFENMTQEFPNFSRAEYKPLHNGYSTCSICHSVEVQIGSLG